MRAYIDNRPIAVPLGSIAEAIAAARSAALTQGRIVVDVMVNGERLDDEALSSPSTMPAGDIEFKCVTAEPRSLVAESFRDVARILQQTRTSQIRAAQSLQTGALDNAFVELEGVLQAWDAVQQVAEQGPALLGVPIAALARGQSADAELTSLAHTLRNVKDAVGSQDWSTLADLLETDLDTSAARWTTLLDSLADTTAGAQGPVK